MQCKQDHARPHRQCGMRRLCFVLQNGAFRRHTVRGNLNTFKIAYLIVIETGT
jgi:hypothetical protein